MSGGGFQHDIAGGNGNLVITSLQAPDYAAGSAGWQIRKDGSAEFNNLTIRGTFHGTNFIINSSGAFFYSGVPAAGNLIISIAPASGIDAFGNSFSAGMTSYNPGGSAQLFGAELLFGSGGPFISRNGNNLQIGGIAGTTAANWLLPFTGGLLAVDPATPATAETWHNMTLTNGWSLGSGGYAQYKLMPDNTVYVRGGNIIPGTVTGGTAIWTMPAAYVPAGQTTRIPMIIENGAAAASALTPRFDAQTAGTLICWNVPAGTTRVGFNDFYALD